MKKLLFIALIICALVSLTGCGSKPQEDRGVLGSVLQSLLRLPHRKQRRPQSYEFWQRKTAHQRKPIDNLALQKFQVYNRVVSNATYQSFIPKR